MRSFFLTLLATAVVTTGAQAEEDCPKRFLDYGLFLQAKKSCGRDDEYPSMKAMRACAKQTPKEEAMKLMDEGRREWVRSVMRTSLGSRCAQVFPEQDQGADKRKRR